MEKSPTTLGRTLSALAVAGAMAALLAQPTAAQTAGNLKCNGCVSSKDIKNKGIKSKDIKDGQVKNADLGNKAVDLSKLTPEMREEIAKNRTFFATADRDGEEVTLATSGPLRIFMRCSLNDGGFDQVEVIVTSSLGPWFAGEKTTPAPAGETGLFGRSTATTNTPMIDIGFPSPVFASDGSAFSGGGSVTTVLNLAGHRCLAFGHATALKGELLQATASSIRRARFTARTSPCTWACSRKSSQRMSTCWTSWARSPSWRGVNPGSFASAES